MLEDKIMAYKGFTQKFLNVWKLWMNEKNKEFKVVNHVVILQLPEDILVALQRTADEGEVSVSEVLSDMFYDTFCTEVLNVSPAHMAFIGGNVDLIGRGEETIKNMSKEEKRSVISDLIKMMERMKDEDCPDK
jgi:hypothetical protein